MISEYNMLSGLYMEKASTNSVMLYSRLNCPDADAIPLVQGDGNDGQPAIAADGMQNDAEPEPADAARSDARENRIGDVDGHVPDRVATETTASPYRLYRTKRRPTNSQPAMKIGMLSSTFHTAGLRVSVM